MNDIATTQLFTEISQLIETTRQDVARYANTGLTLLYWKIGQQIHQNILNEERADYGEQVVKKLAQKLSASYGRGFNATALFRMVRFAKLYPDARTVATLSTLLTWSHFVELIYIEDPLRRQFYTEMCRIEHWSVRRLRDKLGGMLFERTAISHQPEQVIEKNLQALQKQDAVTQDLIFRDPYLLDFLQLPSAFSESDLENAILDELSKFLQELGTDFCFIARQKRITIDNNDFYLDLLMYHRGLHRLVAIELKLGKFQASHKGQMELYLRWLDKYERKPGEKPPLGLILCAEKQQEHVELLELNKSSIHVAQYLTALPPKKLLEEKLHKAIQLAQAKQK